MSEDKDIVSEKDVAHNHTDILLKALENEYNNKSFAAYGLDLPKIVNFRPTDLPIIVGKERFADHVFDLADGSHVIVDYESRYRKKNFIKYGNYATRVLERDMQDDEGYDLRFIVVYTGDVDTAPTEYSTNCLTIKVENVFLSKLDGTGIYREICDKIEAGEPLTDVEQMQMMILPLTERGAEAKVRMADMIIEAAKKIKKNEVKSFVLSGLSIAAAGYLTETQDARILEVLKMTRIGEMIRKEIDEEVAKRLLEERAEERAEVRRETTGLMKFLLSSGRNEDALRATQDEGYLDKLLADYRAGLLGAK